MNVTSIEPPSPHYRAGFQDFFATYPFTHTLTLTASPKPPRIVEASDGRLLAPCRTRGDGFPPEWIQGHFYRYKRDLERRSQRRVGYGYVVEETYPGRPHIHAAIESPGLSVGHVQAAWRYGISQVRRYKPGGRWLAYMAKEIRFGAPWDVGGLAA
jgi:hypothetical protein